MAAQWARGQALYRSAWVDRPQGLMLAYRLLDSIAQTAWAIRLGAVAAATCITLLLVAIGRLADSRSSGLVAGALYAAVGIGPNIEGFTFNGELAAAVPATAAVAAALVAYRSESRRWLVLAALLGGAAILMKQSGFDGLAVVFCVSVLGRRGRRARLGALALALGAAALPLALSALAGWLTGWRFYWSALVSYHLSGSSSLPLGTRLSHLLGTLPAAGRDLLPLALLALFGCWRLRRSPVVSRLALVWLAAALAGVNLGGLYWPHYYVQLLPPLALLGALGLAQLPDRRLVWAATALVAVPALSFVTNVVRAPDSRSDRLVAYAAGYENDQRLAGYVRRHSSPRDSVYALESRADFYFLADRAAASPYLWAHPLNEIPGALASLERRLAMRTRPRFVVLFQQPPRHGEGAGLGPILRRYYVTVWRAPQTRTAVLADVRVLHRR